MYYRKNINKLKPLVDQTSFPGFFPYHPIETNQEKEPKKSVFSFPQNKIKNPKSDVHKGKIKLKKQELKNIQLMQRENEERLKAFKTLLNVSINYGKHESLGELIKAYQSAKQKLSNAKKELEHGKIILNDLKTDWKTWRKELSKWMGWGLAGNLWGAAISAGIPATIIAGSLGIAAAGPIFTIAGIAVLIGAPIGITFMGVTYAIDKQQERDALEKAISNLAKEIPSLSEKVGEYSEAVTRAELIIKNGNVLYGKLLAAKIEECLIKTDCYDAVKFDEMWKKINDEIKQNIDECINKMTDLEAKELKCKRELKELDPTICIQNITSTWQADASTKCDNFEFWIKKISFT